jgi:hypothetical protein
MGVHSLARLPVRRRTETDETEEDRREQNRKGGRESVENENVLFGNVIFPAVTTSGRFSSVGWAREGRVHKVTRASLSSYQPNCTLK